MTDTAEEAMFDTVDELLAKLKAVRISHSMKKAAFLRFSQGAMHGEVAIWTVGEVADYLGISGQAIRKALKDGRLEGTKFGHVWMIRKEKIVDAKGRPPE